MEKRTFLITFIKFAGWFELFLATMMLFMGYVVDYLDLPKGLPFFYQFAAVELYILGYLLLYSARDIEKYSVIIVASCIFRYIMPSGPELYALITLWPSLFAKIMIPAGIYDIGSATLTLVLMKQVGALGGKPAANQ